MPFTYLSQIIFSSQILLAKCSEKTTFIIASCLTLTFHAPTPLSLCVSLFFPQLSHSFYIVPRHQDLQSLRKMGQVLSQASLMAISKSMLHPC